MKRKELEVFRHKRIQGMDEGGSVGIVLGEEAEGETGDWVMAP